MQTGPADRFGPLLSGSLLFWLLADIHIDVDIDYIDVDMWPHIDIDVDMDIDVDVDVDTNVDSCFGCLKGASKSVQV